MTDKEKLKIAIQALKDVIDPIGKMIREVPEGHKFDGHMAVELEKNTETYRRIAQEALDKIR